MKNNEIKGIHVCLNYRNVQKVRFYWSAKFTKCKYQKQSKKKTKIKINKIKAVSDASFS